MVAKATEAAGKSLVAGTSYIFCQTLCDIKLRHRKLYKSIHLSSFVIFSDLYR